MVEPKVSNLLVHMVDVNMAITKSKVIEEHVFKDKKPIVSHTDTTMCGSLNF